MKKQYNTNELIGQRIREAREEMGMSQVDLATALGYESPTAISLIEAGQRKLRIEDLEQIAKTLQRDIKFFLGQIENIPNVQVALRADKDLSAKDKETILHFVELAKNRKDANRDK